MVSDTLQFSITVTPLLRAILHSIADVLGVPVEQFYGNDPAQKKSMGEEDCLRLWRKIGSDKGRAQALKALQAIADEEAI